MSETAGGERQVPFYCPYCGDQDLRPAGETAGSWECASCARFQLADIGLKGSIVDGQEGFQVHLGGSLGVDQAFGRKLRGLKVTSAGLTDYVERILRNYSDDRVEGESFASWVRRADEALLQ